MTAGAASVVHSLHTLQCIMMYYYYAKQKQCYDTVHDSRIIRHEWLTIIPVMALAKSASDCLCLFTTNCQPFWIAQTGSQAAKTKIADNL